MNAICIKTRTQESAMQSSNSNRRVNDVKRKEQGQTKLLTERRSQDTTKAWSLTEQGLNAEGFTLVDERSMRFRVAFPIQTSAHRCCRSASDCRWLDLAIRTASWGRVQVGLLVSFAHLLHISIHCFQNSTSSLIRYEWRTVADSARWA